MGEKVRVLKAEVVQANRRMRWVLKENAAVITDWLEKDPGVILDWDGVIDREYDPSYCVDVKYFWWSDKGLAMRRVYNDDIEGAIDRVLEETDRQRGKGGSHGSNSHCRRRWNRQAMYGSVR